MRGLKNKLGTSTGAKKKKAAMDNANLAGLPQGSGARKNAVPEEGDAGKSSS